jgi:conjugative transposon TraK protein
MLMGWGRGMGRLMFKQFQNVESSFKYIRTFSIVFLIANVCITCYVFYSCFAMLKNAQQKIYVIANNKLIEAVASERKQKLPVEIRDHVATFHERFFNLEPDEQYNQSQIIKALYLCDETAKIQHRELTEAGYYSGIVSGNISQRVTVDSIQLDINQSPWYVKYYGKQSIMRSTSVTIRSLITEAYIRDLGTISDHNPHGFLLERWKILENKDLAVTPR